MGISPTELSESDIHEDPATFVMEEIANDPFFEQVGVAGRPVLRGQRVHHHIGLAAQEQDGALDASSIPAQVQEQAEDRQAEAEQHHAFAARQTEKRAPLHGATAQQDRGHGCAP